MSERMALAEQCRTVELSAQTQSLVEVAVDLHCVANQRSSERFRTDQSYRERARLGYRGELAVAQHYALTPTVDYRPPGAGDAGHDYRVRYAGDTDLADDEGDGDDSGDGDGEIVTVDVKATRTDPPALYLTKKRAWADDYTLPDYYLLTAPALAAADDQVPLVGWVDSDTVREVGVDDTVNGNAVWRLDGLDLATVPDRDAIADLSGPERALYSAADRAGADDELVQQWAADVGVGADG